MRALLTVAICVSIAGCASVPDAAPPAAVAISTACEDLAQTVDGPAWRQGADAKVVLADTTLALRSANGNLVATHDCQAQQRGNYARDVKK